MSKCGEMLQTDSGGEQAVQGLRGQRVNVGMSSAVLTAAPRSAARKWAGPRAAPAPFGHRRRDQNTGLRQGEPDSISKVQQLPWNIRAEHCRTCIINVHRSGSRAGAAEASGGEPRSAPQRLTRYAGSRSAA